MYQHVPARFPHIYPHTLITHAFCDSNSIHLSNRVGVTMMLHTCAIIINVGAARKSFLWYQIEQYLGKISAKVPTLIIHASLSY